MILLLIVSPVIVPPYLLFIFMKLIFRLDYSILGSAQSAAVSIYPISICPTSICPILIMLLLSLYKGPNKFIKITIVADPPTITSSQDRTYSEKWQRLG